MIVSQNGTTYDTSDGSEQPHAASTERLASREDRAARNQMDDDGAPAGAGPTAASVEVLGAKPAWSVLSLRDLNEARRRSVAARPREEAERVERARLSAEQARERRVDAAEQAGRDRYRNAWETT